MTLFVVYLAALLLVAAITVEKNVPVGSLTVEDRYLVPLDDEELTIVPWNPEQDARK